MRVSTDWIAMGDEAAKPARSTRPLRERLPWIPCSEGELECCNCGNFWGGKMAPCGIHAYCSLCRGRGRDDDHDCAEHDEPSAVFHRMDRDCRECGQRHLDWERCAAIWNERAKDTPEEQEEEWDRWIARIEEGYEKAHEGIDDWARALELLKELRAEVARLRAELAKRETELARAPFACEDTGGDTGGVGWKPQ